MNATPPVIDMALLETRPEPSSTAALSVMVDSPLPVFTGEQMARALTAYRDLQMALDRSMPEQIMQLDGKPFRKKGYWRAIAVAFGLKVEPIAERREVSGEFADGRENFGYVVDYRATAPNGRSVVSDGTCFAVEKARRFKCPHLKPGSDRYAVHFPHNTCPDFDANFQWRVLPGDATEHNVRGHAHTRAFNRSVSNLVGFGEVSAEEVVRGEDDAPAAAPVTTASAPPAQPVAAQHAQPARSSASAPVQPPQRRAEAPASGGSVSVISEPQAKRFWAIAKGAGHADGGKAFLAARGIASDREIPRSKYEQLCADMQAREVGAEG